MTARLQRKGPLPDKHLLQIRIYRTADPEIYDYLERLEIGEISARIKSAIKKGIGAADTGSDLRPNAKSSAHNLATQTSSRRNAEPTIAGASETAVSKALHDVDDRASPPAPVVPTQAMDPDLMRLLAEEDASS
ncbi:hypothetical protein [Thauera aminoaromatica]|uniref:Uncharacterized protein n=1 Tax=Thauera aminoaromatica TaxID=164330 RepID=A0A5C7T9D6_THASP|nr:hypothetical protein [Thauera aminoaromatica]TXH92307.1 MAG: hypothetical protein E6Q80_00780 [Thauera aminoaromatica]